MSNTALGITLSFENRCTKFIMHFILYPKPKIPILITLSLLFYCLNKFVIFYTNNDNIYNIKIKFLIITINFIFLIKLYNKNLFL